MNYTFYEIMILLFSYSFLGWVAETTVATIKEKNFRNRGFVSGPFCFIYGLSSVVLTVFLQELRNNPVYLFVGSAIISTTIEWFAGKTLERMKQKKWWDYSEKRWNFDGYICLQYSILWGLMGFGAVRYTNDWLLVLYRCLPAVVRTVAVWVLVVIGIVDIIGVLVGIYHLEKKLPRLFKWNLRLQKWTETLSAALARHVDDRIKRVYPTTVRQITESQKMEAQTQEHAKADEHCGIEQLFWLFLIGAFLGDIVETIFCRVTAGVWMSRSSLVWGPFSIVWGLALALATALLHKDRNKPDRYIFFVGTFLGGAYEYICSVFTEIVFGKVFWDYSEIPFNLGGRINLLYCFFWGIAAVAWIKILYPPMNDAIRTLLKKTGRWLTIIAMVFMLTNVSVSMLALIRYDSRAKGVVAEAAWEEIMDERFNDARMERIYPNAKQR